MLDRKFKPGPILWARYSFAPNRLKYCGPDANLELFEYAAAKISSPRLSEILTHFEAAFPYIQFIAQENKIKDPFDSRVVEAYWLGNDLLNHISLDKFYRHLKGRFRKRAKLQDFRALESKIPAGAKPFHAFHVLEIYQRFGSSKGIDLGPMLETINHCLIGWGRVVKVKSDNLHVGYRPLLINNKLYFGPNEIKTIEYRYQKKALITPPQIGDWVSFHWNWACDILTERQLKNLQKWTLWHLNIANKTI